LEPVAVAEYYLVLVVVLSALMAELLDKVCAIQLAKAALGVPLGAMEQRKAMERE
jgi:hypothetical protein